MAVDYDLVILGGSREGRLAALQAAHWRSRVALIEPPAADAPDFLFLLLEHLRQGVDLAAARSRATQLADRPSLAFLATQGVDVRIGQAEFQRPFAVAVNGRILRSRTYLLAPRAQPIDRGLTLEAIAQADTLPTGKISVVGSNPLALELSQILARSSATVTLHLPQPLLGVDVETSWRLRSSLEADSIQIETEFEPPTGTAISTLRQPQLAALNLEAVGVTLRAGVVPVNGRLQTKNPRIYACGDALGGYWLPHVAEVEAAIAAENALFWPRQNINYTQIPWAIRTRPELAQVGLTERQARRQYGATVQILRQAYRSIQAATVSGESIGLCKLILRQGKILGAHLVGTNASETIAPVALALQQQRSIQSLASIAPSATWNEILSQSAQQWQRDRLANWQRDWLERWFDWRK